jgi:uncharacterized protein DUF4440
MGRTALSKEENMSRLAAALVAGLAIACAAHAADSAHTADGVKAAEQARADALLKADTTALSRLLSDDFVEISRLGALRTKADNIRDIASGDLKLLTVKYDSTNVRVYGDVAVLRAIANNTGLFHGQPFAGRIWYTRVFVWKDGRWQAVTMQQTPIPG